MRLLRWRDWSLATRLTVTMTLLAALPLLLVTLYNSHREQAELLAAARAEGRQRALGTAAIVDAHLSERLDDIQVLALRRTVRDYLAGATGSRDALTQALEQVQQVYGYVGVNILDVEGRVVASTDPRLIGQERITDPAFRVAVAGQLYAGELHLHEETATPVVHLAAPVRAEEGRLLGAVVIHISFGFIDQLIAHDADFAGPGGYGMLWDDDGLILAHSARPELRFTPLVPLPPDVASQIITEQRFGERTEALLASAGDEVAVMERSRALLYDPQADPYLRLRTPDGEWTDVVIVPLVKKRWLYGLFIPESNLLAEVKAQTQNALIAAGLAVVAASAVGLLLARQIARPIRAVANAARAIAAGELGQRIRWPSHDEIGRLAADFDVMAETLQRHTAALEAANKELEAFSYSVSHDLRAPLRAMDGFSRILLEEYASQLSPEAQRYLRLVRDSARQMGLLIDDLLAFSRLSRQPLNKQPVAPAKLVRQALEELRAEQEGRRIEIIIGDPSAGSGQALPICQADPILLKQVFVNLLSNALKFTRRREVARIEVGYLPRPGEGGEGGAYFVKDNGVGFDMRYADKLFGVFQRLHRAEEYEGTGVGLAIVQRIIHRHGGRVWAEAEVDGGATFYFTIPKQ